MGADSRVNLNFEKNKKNRKNEAGRIAGINGYDVVNSRIVGENISDMGIGSMISCYVFGYPPCALRGYGHWLWKFLIIS